MTVKGGSRPACAACRFQRRRCSSDCPLAPFFPANEPKIFQNVHRLYGVGNVMKILNLLKDDEQKEEAMKSIKYESHIREIFPVDGCYGRIFSLHRNLAESIRELQYVRLLLHACKKNKNPGTQNSLINDGSTNWTTNDPMIKEQVVYNFGSSDHNAKNYANWDDEVKPSFDDLSQMQTRFDEFRLSGGEQGDGSPDYSDHSLVDDQLWFIGAKEDQDLSLLSTKPLAFC